MKKILVGLAVLGGLGLGAFLLAAVVFRVGGDPAERFLAAFRPAPSGNPYPDSSPLHEQLDAATINAWLDLSFETTVAQLRNAPVTKQALADAMRRLQEALPESEARRLARALGSPAETPDPDLC